MSIPMPRFRGNAIQVGSAWSWELLITVGPDSVVEPIVMTHNGALFINREAALNSLREIIPKVMSEVCSAMGLPQPDAVHDLNAHEVKSIDEFKKEGRHD